MRRSLAKFGAGVAVGLVPTFMRWLDGKLAEYDERGPMSGWWYEHVVWPWQSKVRRPMTDAMAKRVRATVERPTIEAVLGRRRWRVAYISVCFYGNDPKHGGQPPRVVTYSWHWTERGAEWHRRHRPDYVGFGSFRCVTLVEHDNREPLDPTDISWWNAHFGGAA